VADILDRSDTITSDLRGTYRAKIRLSYTKQLERDPNIIQWKLQWIVDDEASAQHGEAVWENFYFYNNLTEDDIEHMTGAEKGRLRRNWRERTERLTSLGVEDPSEVDHNDKEFFGKFVGFEADITVNTNNSGRTSINRNGVHPVTEDVNLESTAIDI
jgi:hypothetical protein